MAGSKKRRGALVYLNVIFWSLAVLVWSLVFIRKSAAPPAGEPPGGGLYITGSRSKPPAPPPITSEDTVIRRKAVDFAPEISIIIDDFGPAWDDAVVQGFIELPFEVTLSVIPGNRTTTSAAKRAAAAEKEIFIHLPMEPEERIAMDERDMLLSGSSAERVRAVLKRAIQEIPGARGVNNHMGSKATADRKLMGRVAEELKRSKLSFVDSRTTERSVALRAMQQTGIPAIGRDVFLDVETDSANVAERLYELAFIARRRGWAVGIGHVKRNTLAAMRAVLPTLQKDGFRFVFAGDLIEELSEPAL